MKSIESRIRRFYEIEKLLLAHPDGLKKAEIARRLGVHRSTIQRDMEEFSRVWLVYEKDDGSLALNTEDYIDNIRLGLHEIAALHFAIRLMARRMNYQYIQASSAISKLAMAIKHKSPGISKHMFESAEMMSQPGEAKNDLVIENIMVLTRAWYSQIKVKVNYYSKSKNHVEEFLFEPFLIEPYSEGHSFYTIGRSSRQDGALRTLKLERILSLQPTLIKYQIPEDFSIQQHFANAWGIWVTDSPEKVELKFSSRVKDRVKETRWHSSQIMEEDDQGNLIWRAEIDQPMEMYPWIRSWGSGVEIIKPLWLREKVIQEARDIMKIYGQ